LTEVPLLGRPFRIQPDAACSEVVLRERGDDKELRLEGHADHDESGVVRGRLVAAVSLVFRLIRNLDGTLELFAVQTRSVSVVDLSHGHQGAYDREVGRLDCPETLTATRYCPSAREGRDGAIVADLAGFHEEVAYA
jgi:hypothetical protein